jgi:hypothetical protein
MRTGQGVPLKKVNWAEAVWANTKTRAMRVNAERIRFIKMIDIGLKQ